MTDIWIVVQTSRLPNGPGPMSIEFHHKCLSNGLTVLAETNGDAHTAAVGFFVKTGSRDETSRLMGVSHFLEHMMFKGTEGRTAEDVNREFDEIGANYNASTSHENTVYWAHVLPEFLPRAIDLIGDILRPKLRGEDFDMEKNVILEEIGMYEDRPQWRLQDTIIETYFGSHPLGFRVLGTNETIGALPVEDMRAYFQDRYSPDNITVAVTGQIEFDRVLESVQSIAGGWKPTGATRSFDQPALADREQTLTDPKLSRHYVAVMCPAPAAQDDRRYAAGVIADVLGDSEGSRLYWALVDTGLADEADMSYMAQDGIGSYVAFASCDPDRADEVQHILLEKIDEFGDTIEVDEIERAKNKIATEATVHGESPGGRMHSMGGQWTYLGRYIPLSQEIERMMAVTSEDVCALVKDMPYRPRTIVRLGPR